MALVSRAFLLHENHLYFSTSPHHPVGSLIEGIWSQFPDQARAITRNRIFSNIELTPFCDGLLKVAAKRATVLTPLEFEQQWLAASSTGVLVNIQEVQSIVAEEIEVKSSAYTETEALALAQELSIRSKLAIGAVLLDPLGKIISWGWNDHFPNKTRHAEVMLVHNFLARFQKKIPTGCTLVSTLQPCAMCAGYLHEYCEYFSSLRVIYAEEDPGPHAQNSILIPGSHLWTRYQSATHTH